MTTPMNDFITYTAELRDRDDRYVVKSYSDRERNVIAVDDYLTARRVLDMLNDLAVAYAHPAASSGPATIWRVKGLVDFRTGSKTVALRRAYALAVDLAHTVTGTTVTTYTEGMK